MNTSESIPEGLMLTPEPKNNWVTRVRSRLSYELFLARRMQGWKSFLLWRIGLKRPFNASTGTSKFLVDDEAKRRQLSSRMRKWYSIWPLEEEESEDGNGTIMLKFGTRTLRFQYNRDSRSDFIGILQKFFLEEPYKVLDVKGRVVVDVGADIGDSAIYFCCQGATKVISFEPYPYFYEFASKNIIANGFKDKVVLYNEGGGRNAELRVSPEKLVPWTELKGSDQGKRVRTNNLRNLLERFHLDSAVLKVNCEGCEYDFFDDATADDFAHFSQIMLQYHHGSEPFVKKFKAAGCSVKVWDVRLKQEGENGYILATPGSPRALESPEGV